MKSSIAAAFLCVLFGPFGAFCVVWTFLFAGRAEWLSAAVALGFAVFTLGMVAMLVVVASRKVSPRIMCHDAATTFRPDARIDRCLIASTVGVFTAMVVYAVFAPFDMLVIPTPRGDQKYYVAMSAVGAIIGVFSMRQIARQRGMSILRMSADGVEMGNSMTTARRTWDELVDIADRPRNGRKPTGTTYLATDEGHVRTLPSDWYTPAGRALRDLMRFYWAHPEHREELANGEAVERLKAAARGAE
ncbi:MULTISPECIES: hypothetical protein [unclassified Mycolicibacterium]|uniref:hypothetical protein n=1 Tax=unclassified Mycolicibacterium TaxID=2636767 RepID=UPI002ED77D0B